MSESSEKLSNLAMMAMGETINHLKEENERLRAELASMKVAAECAIEYVAEREREECEKTRTELAAAKAVIENIVVSEVEPLKALLREALPSITCECSHCNRLRKDIRAAIGDEPK